MTEDIDKLIFHCQVALVVEGARPAAMEGVMVKKYALPTGLKFVDSSWMKNETFIVKEANAGAFAKIKDCYETGKALGYLSPLYSLNEQKGYIGIQWMVNIVDEKSKKPKHIGVPIFGEKIPSAMASSPKLLQRAMTFETALKNYFPRSSVTYKICTYCHHGAADPPDLYKVVKDTFLKHAADNQKCNAQEFAANCTLVAAGARPAYLWMEHKGEPSSALVQALTGAAKGALEFLVGKTTLIVARPGETAKVSAFLESKMDKPLRLFMLGTLLGYMDPGQRPGDKYVAWLVNDAGVVRMLYAEGVRALGGVDGRHAALSAALHPLPVTYEVFDKKADLTAAYNKYQNY